MDDVTVRMGKIAGLWTIEITVPKWAVNDIERDSKMTAFSPPKLTIKSYSNYGTTQRSDVEYPDDPFDGWASVEFELKLVDPEANESKPPSPDGGIGIPGREVK